jgi:hypothetical protein
MLFVYIIKQKDLIVGIYDNLDLFVKNTGIEDDIPKFSEDENSISFGKYCIEKVKINENNIKPNQIIYKGKEFNINNLEDPLPLVDVSDPTYL